MRVVGDKLRAFAGWAAFSYPPQADACIPGSAAGPLGRLLYPTEVAQAHYAAKCPTERRRRSER